MNELYQRDAELLSGWDRIMGVDEAGRGALAGPVVCAAVTLNYERLIDGLDDSKRLSPKRREILYREILENAVAYKIVEIPPSFIDEHNILQATLEGMRQAITAIAAEDCICFVDGPFTPSMGSLMSTFNRLHASRIFFKTDPITQQKTLCIRSSPQFIIEPVINGDALHACIAAASILAKVWRDRYMTELHKQYPQYHFDRHKGYGTALHLAALREYGPCPIHRFSFAPVRA